MLSYTRTSQLCYNILIRMIHIQDFKGGPFYICKLNLKIYTLANPFYEL